MTNSAKRSFGAAGLALAGLIMLGAGCAAPSAGTPPEATPPRPEAKADAIVQKDAAQEAAKEDRQAAPPATPALATIRVVAKQFSFDPAEIRVKQGDKVKLELVSEDVTHGFSLPAFKINETLDAGKTVTVEFTADKKGTFPFMCNAFCGSGHGGMRGSLIVE